MPDSCSKALLCYDVIMFSFDKWGNKYLIIMILIWIVLLFSLESKALEFLSNDNVENIFCYEKHMLCYVNHMVCYENHILFIEYHMFRYGNIFFLWETPTWLWESKIKGGF